MSNNKLKNMIENHEFDDFVNNEELKEKLCKLQTSEEVLELLKKYNYNESKEIFEVELMDLLKDYIDEEELLKVSGGGADRKNFSKMITSLALAGTLCVPAQGVTGKEQRSTITNRKSSYSVGLPPKEKVAIGVAGIVGVGVILEEVLRHTVFAKKDKNCGEITNQEYTEMRKHFMKIATRPQDCKTEDFEKYTVNKLKGYILAELIEWFKAMAKYYEVESNPPETPTSDQSSTDRGAFAQDWNSHLPDLIGAEHALIALFYVSGFVGSAAVKNYLGMITSSPLNLNLLEVEPQTIYIWGNGLRPINELHRCPWSRDCTLDSMLNPDGIKSSVETLLANLLMDCSKKFWRSENRKLDTEWATIATTALSAKTDFASTLWYENFIELIGEK